MQDIQLKRQKGFLSLALLFLFVGLMAQPAPDYTITDTDGITRSLYADHLDQGQTVVLKVFFTTCPPCISIAPVFQDLYEDWGEGLYDVEFMELSNKGWDSNADVLAYQTSNGLTYIGAGNDGGGNAAQQKFTDGTFGPFFGTPTFIVIAPDGTVNYDVSGPGNSGTIAAIDAAIAATGATGMDTAPHFTSYAFNVEDLDNNPVTDFDLYLRSGTDPSIVYNISDLTSGTLQFDYPSTLFPLISDPELYCETTSTIPYGVSAIDLLAMQKHILGLDLILDPFLILAADVNDSGSISAIDLLEMKRVLIGIEDEFPGKDFWVYYFPNCGNCTTSDLPISIGNTVTLDITAVATGDID